MKFLNFVNKGAFGIVYKVEEDNKEYAIKRNFVKSPNFFTSKFREVDIMLKCKKSKNIVSIKSIYCSNNFNKLFENKIIHSNIKNDKIDDIVHFTMKYAISDLSNSINNSNMMNYTLILKDILLGLRYLHSLSIIHCDLKMNNVLIFEKDGNYYTKLADFGLAIFNDYNTEFKNFKISCLQYKSPETLLSYDFDEKLDIWAFGCIVYEMYTNGKLLYFKQHSKKISNDDMIINQLKYIVNRNYTFRNKKDLRKFFIENFDINNIIMNNRRFNNYSELILNKNNEILFDDSFKEELNELLFNSLHLDYRKRYSANKLLKLDIFNNFKIDKLKNNNIDDIVNISKNNHRNIIHEEIIFIMKNNLISWLNIKIIIHSIHMFDRLEYLFELNNIDIINSIYNKIILHLKNNEIYKFILHIIFVIFYQYFYIFDVKKTYEQLFPEKYHNKYCKKYALNLQKKFFIEILNYDIYKKTIYEYIMKSDKIKKINIRKIMKIYFEENVNTLSSFEIVNKYIE